RVPRPAAGLTPPRGRAPDGPIPRCHPRSAGEEVGDQVVDQVGSEQDAEGAAYARAPDLGPVVFTVAGVGRGGAKDLFGLLVHPGKVAAGVSRRLLMVRASGAVLGRASHSILVPLMSDVAVHGEPCHASRAWSPAGTQSNRKSEGGGAGQGVTRRCRLLPCRRRTTRNDARSRARGHDSRRPRRRCRSLPRTRVWARGRGR